jgi:hypothetical protein
MDDARLPEPEPSGALVPPPVHPPTALATAAPLLPRRPDDALEVRNLVARVVERALDALDRAADSIASAVGLR